MHRIYTVYRLCFEFGMKSKSHLGYYSVSYGYKKIFTTNFCYMFFRPIFLASCTVQFSYVETYPDEPPVFEITESDNIEEDQIQELLDLMTEQVVI